MSELNPFLLQVSIILPFVAGLMLFFSGDLKSAWVKAVAFVGFAVPGLIAIWLYSQYADAQKMAYAYAFFSDTKTGLEDIGISLKLGLNGISLPMYLLAAIVGFAAGLFAMNSGAQRLHLYLALLLVMFSGLMGTFASIDIFFFYFFHELALIPTFIMIGIWGGRGRRSTAMELTIYLTLGAMLALIGLIALYNTSGLASFDLISLKGYLDEHPIMESVQRNVFGVLLFGFGILVSLFPFHTWAPRGYGAAPSSAAMLHAGVLKKFGLYGLIQIAAPLLPAGIGHWAYFLALLALCNVVIIGVITMAQRDLKQMVGYSSVMHMGYCFLGIVSLSTMGIGATVLLMFAHGLSVALLFLLSTVIYKRTETYDMTVLGGMSQKAPVLCGFFLAAVLANIGLPGFANFWGEIAVFISLWDFEPWMVFPAVAGVVISAIYGLRAVASIFLGQPSEEFKEKLNESVTDISCKERVPALILLGALLIVGFCPKWITKPLSFNLEKMETQVVAMKDVRSE